MLPKVECSVEHFCSNFRCYSHAVVIYEKWGNKKRGQATHIAPLQPATLASFLTWGSSPGAGRMRLALAAAKVKL